MSTLRANAHHKELIAEVAALIHQAVEAGVPMREIITRSGVPKNTISNWIGHHPPSSLGKPEQARAVIRACRDAMNDLAQQAKQPAPDPEVMEDLDLLLNLITSLVQGGVSPKRLSDESGVPLWIVRALAVDRVPATIAPIEIEALLVASLNHTNSLPEAVEDPKAVKLTPRVVARIKRALNDGVPPSDLALRFDVHKNTILGIRRGQIWGHVDADGTIHSRTIHSKLSPAQVVSIRDAHRDGESIDSIAERFGLHPQWTRSIVRGKAWAHVTEADRDTAFSVDHDMHITDRGRLARLTPCDVAAIRSRAKGGETIASLVAEFGVSRSTIRNIIIGKTWRHVLPDGTVLPPEDPHTFTFDGPPPAPDRPLARPQYKLAPNQVAQLRQERQMGASRSQLAERYGISTTQVSRICRYQDHPVLPGLPDSTHPWKQSEETRIVIIKNRAERRSAAKRSASAIPTPPTPPPEPTGPRLRDRLKARRRQQAN